MSIPKLVKDIAGQKFNMLTAVEYVGSNNGAVWKFLCDCGTFTVLNGSIARGGHVKSCGCLSVSTQFAKTEIVVGTVFNGVTVICRLPDRGHNKEWLCRCSCGNEFNALGSNLRSGNTKSCGCHRVRVTKERATTHGMSNTRIYHLWQNMRRRCEDPKNDRYDNYGGRGITVCERWKDFDAFYADMGERPAGKSLDRINNDLGYSPENCRWATQTEQMRNMRGNVMITINGVTRCIAEWAEISGIPASRIRVRKMVLGWDENDLLKPHAYKGHG